MTTSRPIALSGLPSTEQVLLEGALFPVGGGAVPGIHQVHDVTQAQLILADGDDAQAVSALQARSLPAKVLLLGSSPQGADWPFVTRPLRLHAVLEAVRRQLGPLHPPGTESFQVEDDANSTLPDHAFAATQPFIPPSPDVAGDSGLMGLGRLGQYDATQPMPRYEATQPLGAVREIAAGSSPRQIPPHPHVPFEATRPFTGSHDGNYHPAQQLDLEVPSVAPSAWESDWESEVAEWEARQNANRQGAKHVPHSVFETLTPSTPPAATVPPSVQLPPSSRAVPVTAPTQSASNRVLIVSQPGPASTGLLKILQFAGYPADLAPDRELAFHYLGQQAYRFVFLVEITLGTEVFDLCSAIRRDPGAAIKPPYVVIGSFRRSISTRMRAWLVGCHTWMTVPLNKTMLLEYLERHGH